jgi:hypothetical protein
MPFPKESTPTPTPKPTTTPTETPEPQKPDLEIRDMYVYPSQPQVGTEFTVQVNVANIGETKSGSYDLFVRIYDVSRDSYYPVGTFRQEPINPNYQVIWSSEPVLVNFAGAHQLWAEIAPFDFEDGDDSNNMQGWTFTVTS